MIGSRQRRREDKPLLTGEAEFLDDLGAPDTLHAAFVRSTVAHGTITALDISVAAQQPGVVGVYTGNDLRIPPITPKVDNPNVATVPQPVLPIDRVRFAGEPLAVVVATDRYLAEDAAECVTVDIEPIRVVSDTSAAVAPQSPRLHDLDSNVIFDRYFENGDVTEAISAADVTFERTYQCGRQSAVPMEPRGVYSVPSSDGRLEVYSSMQAPNRLRDELADIMSRSQDSIRVLAPDIGGSFGQKGNMFPEDVVVPWLSALLFRSVKWVEDRTENLMAASHARDQSVSVTVGARRDGTITAIDAVIVVDLGAYGTQEHGPLVEAGGTPGTLPGPYKLEAYRYHSSAMVTNKGPYGAYRGVGATIATFVRERLVDTLALVCHLDPVQVRLRNFIAPSDMPFTNLTGHRYDTGDYPHSLDVARRRILPVAAQRRRDFDDTTDIHIGTGFASFVEYAAVTPAEYERRGMYGARGDDSARLELDDEGIIHVWTTLPGVGQGSATTFAQIAATAMNVPDDRIVVHRTDTQFEDLVGTGTGSSRSMVSGGTAIWYAARKLVEEIHKSAASSQRESDASVSLHLDGVHYDVLGEVREVVPYIDIRKSAPEQTLAAVATAAPEEMVYPSGSHACVVAVNEITGATRVLDYLVVEDCGRVVNPDVVEGQIRGGVAQGIGAALLEEHIYDDDGQLQTSLMKDYQVPASVDVPDIAVELVGEPTPTSVLGVKGVGESAAIPSPVAVANAVSDATRTEVCHIPVTPDWVSSVYRDTEQPSTDGSETRNSRSDRRSRWLISISAMVGVAGALIGAWLASRRSNSGRRT